MYKRIDTYMGVHDRLAGGGAGLGASGCPVSRGPRELKREAVRSAIQITLFLFGP
jgi:hypothetical protein